MNTTPEATDKFRQIREAYQHFVDGISSIQEEVESRKEAEFESWLKEQERKRRYRSAYEDAWQRTRFQQHTSKWSRSMRFVIHLILIALLSTTIVVPIFLFCNGSYQHDSTPQFIYFALSIAIGIIFVAWAIYYWFIKKTDN